MPRASAWGGGGGGGLTFVSVTPPMTGDGTPGSPLDVPDATISDPGLMSAANVTKLAGIATGATNTPISVATPQPVGTATAGASGMASDAGHAHDLPDVGPGVGAVANPSSITLDAKGRVTAASAGSAPPSYPLSIANGGTGSATGDASALISLPAAQLTGNAPLASIATALAAGGGAIGGTVITASTRIESPTIGTSLAAQHALPSGTAELLSADSTATVTNKSIDAAQLTGSLADARLSANVVTLTGSQTLTNKSIAASQLTGVVAAANGGSTTGTNGSSVQVTGTVNLGGSATWTDVTLSVALPGTGMYIIAAAIRSVLVMSSGIGAISFKLVNATAGTDIADSIRVGPYGVSLTQNVATANLFAIVSIVGAATIKAQASCAAFGGTYSTTNVVSDSSLATNQMNYVQIA